MEIFKNSLKTPVGYLEIITTENALVKIIFINEKKFFSKKMPIILKNTIIQLEEYFEGKRKKFDLKIVLEGTDFQLQVWRSLQTIDYGKTISYKEQAIKINNPKSYRAVGTTNGKNPIPIILPCHRVIGSNGNLTGYGGGLDKKIFLLKHEQNNFI